MNIYWCRYVLVFVQFACFYSSAAKKLVFIRVGTIERGVYCGGRLFSVQHVHFF